MTVLAKLLSLGESKYRISTMYLEFENVDAPEDPVAAPVFDRTRNIDYYNDLVSNPDRDYLRVPLSSALVEASDESLYPGGNRLVLTARSSGTTGVHGKTFSDSVNSKIFGAALVAQLDKDDASQDLIISAMYLSEASQQLKLPTSQNGLEWLLTLQ